MSDLLTSLREYFEEIAPPVDISTVTDTQLKPGPPQAARWRPALAAAVVVIAAGAVTGGILATRPGVPAGTTVGGSAGSTSTLVQSTSSLASPSTTTVPSPKVDVAAMADAKYFVYGVDGIRADSGRLIWEPNLVVGETYIARDGLGGFVFVDLDGLWWVRSGADKPVLVAGPELEAVLLREVIVTDDGPVARFQEPAEGDVLVDVFVDLATGQVVDTTLSGRMRLAGDREWWVVGDLAVSVTGPQIKWFEEGGLDEVIEPAHLTVSRAPDGATPTIPVFDIVIGTYEEEFARIHDFDGQRIVVSTGPYEPVSPPETFYIIDLACADCLITFRAGSTHVALNGSDVVPPDEVQVPALPQSSRRQ